MCDPGVLQLRAFRIVVLASLVRLSVVHEACLIAELVAPEPTTILVPLVRKSAWPRA